MLAIFARSKRRVFSTNFDSILYLDFSSSLITFSMYFFLTFYAENGKTIEPKRYNATSCFRSKITIKL